MGPHTAAGKIFGVGALLLLLTPTAHAQDVPPDPTVIDPALVLHVSADGLEAFGESIRNLMPTGIGVTGLEGTFDCSNAGGDDDSATGDDDSAAGDDDSAALEELYYAVEDLRVHMSADEVTVVPSENRLDIIMGLTVWSDEVNLIVQGQCMLSLDEACTFAIEPTPVVLQVGLQLALDNGNLQTQIDTFDLFHGDFGNPISTGCVLGDALETLGGLGVDLIGGVLDSVMEGQVEELASQIENILGGITAGLNYQGDLDVLDATLSINLQANSLEISETGMAIGVEASFGTPAYGSCVPQTGAYEPSTHDPPALTGILPGSDLPYHLGLLINQDTINQALYAAWQGGVLCLQVSSLTDLEITTDYLALIDEELVEDLWPTPQTLDLRIAADEPPQADLASGPQIDAALRLDIYGDELDRTTRFWANGIIARAGLEPALEEGALDLGLQFNPDTDLGITVAYNEWVPSTLPEGFAGLIPSLLDQFLDLETLAAPFTLPSFYGIGLHDFEVIVQGDEDDYLGLYAWTAPQNVTALELGEVNLGGVGCGDTSEGGEVTVEGCGADSGLGCEGGGAQGSGCEGGEDGGCGGCGGEEGSSDSCGGGGCSTARRGSPRLFFAVLLPALLALRRRR